MSSPVEFARLHQHQKVRIEDAFKKMHYTEDQAEAAVQRVIQEAQKTSRMNQAQMFAQDNFPCTD